MKIENGVVLLSSFKGIYKRLARYVYNMGIGTYMPLNDKFLGITELIVRYLKHFQNTDMLKSAGHCFYAIEGVGVVKVIWHKGKKPVKICKVAGAEMYYCGSIAIPNKMKNPNYITIPDRCGYYLTAKVEKGVYGEKMKYPDIDGGFINFHE